MSLRLQSDEALMKADQDAWWNDIVKKLERMLRQAALKLFNEKTLDSDQMHNYFMSGESNVYTHTHNTYTRTSVYRACKYRARKRGWGKLGAGGLYTPY